MLVEFQLLCVVFRSALNLKYSHTQIGFCRSSGQMLIQNMCGIVSIIFSFQFPVLLQMKVALFTFGLISETFNGDNRNYHKLSLRSDALIYKPFSDDKNAKFRSNLVCILQFISKDCIFLPEFGY